MTAELYVGMAQLGALLWIAYRVGSIKSDIDRLKDRVTALEQDRDDFPIQQ